MDFVVWGSLMRCHLTYALRGMAVLLVFTLIMACGARDDLFGPGNPAAGGDTEKTSRPVVTKKPPKRKPIRFKKRYQTRKRPYTFKKLFTTVDKIRGERDGDRSRAAPAEPVVPADRHRPARAAWTCCSPSTTPAPWRTSRRSWARRYLS